MRALVLQEIQNGSLTTGANLADPSPDEKILKMLFCGICRTDARMWASGHRDLVLPRVLGHEIAAWDNQERSYCTVWPAAACGNCAFCRDGRDNLCDSLQIIGFHRNGGFAEQIVVPVRNIIHAPRLQSPELLCFAEPIGCIVNALSGCNIDNLTRVVIYGAGVLGMLAGMYCRQHGATVEIIEPSRSKREKVLPFCRQTDVSVESAPAGGAYDLSLNCCDDPNAFIDCLEKLRKGGNFRFFSGLRSDNCMTVDAINLIHYKELEVRGCYGPRSSDMKRALEVIRTMQRTLHLLVEDTISLNGIEKPFQHVNSGRALKYIIDINR